MGVTDIDVFGLPTGRVNALARYGLGSKSVEAMLEKVGGSKAIIETLQ